MFQISMIVFMLFEKKECYDCHARPIFLKYYPQHMILLSLLLSTFLGALLLALPVCRLTDIAFIDLFYLCIFNNGHRTDYNTP